MSVVERVHTWAHLMHMREADPSIEGQCFLGTHIFSRLAEVDHTQAAGVHDVHDSKHAVLLVALEADCMLPADTEGPREGRGADPGHEAAPGAPYAKGRYVAHAR